MIDFHTYLQSPPEQLNEVAPANPSYKTGDRVVRHSAKKDGTDGILQGTVGRTTPTKAVVQWDADPEMFDTADSQHRQNDGILVGHPMSSKWDQQRASRTALQKHTPLKTGDAVTSGRYEKQIHKGTVVDHDLEKATVEWQDGKKTVHRQMDGSGYSQSFGKRIYGKDDDRWDGSDADRRDHAIPVTDKDNNKISHDQAVVNEKQKQLRSNEIERMKWLTSKMYDDPELLAHIYKVIGAPK